MQTCVLQDGRSPLYIACSNAHLEVVKALLEVGADANQQDKEGMLQQEV